MEFQLLTDPLEFQERTRELLEDEAKNNLMLAILNSIIENPASYDGFRLMAVRNGDATAVCALMTVPPQNLIIADPVSEAAMETLVEGVLDADFEVPRVIGARPTVDRFVEHWCRLTGEPAELTMAQGVYALREVVPPHPVPGRARSADASDLAIALRWMKAFYAEALRDEPTDEEGMRRAVAAVLRGASGTGLWLWEVDGVPTSMSSHSGPAGSGVRIRAVYTPPEHRGRGYASALVAAQSQALLDNGYRMCSLFTDLSNPTSNKIYESIGYQLVTESAVFRLHPASQ
jgi:predicted GNAT family acetyltransferase